MKYASDLWDALTHCTEPKGNEQVVQFLNKQVTEQSATSEAAKPTQLEVAPAPTASGPRYIDEFEKDADQGLYHLSGHDESGMPIRHPSWKAEWILSLTGEQGENDDEPVYYWQVFQNEQDAKTVLRSESKEHDFRDPEAKDNTLVFRFKAKYRMGKAAFDENGQYKVAHYTPPLYYFNYAEHALLGDNLDLQWPNDEKTKGSGILNLKNGNKLTYGQINALGGDFFATLDPICLGATFEEQCSRFQKAYNTLGHDEIAVVEARAIVENRQKELDAVKDAAASGQSTSEAYKGLKSPGMTRVLDKEDEDLTRITWGRTGPSYIRMAQLNLDHFGEEARTAYNAGHTMALKTAAAGDLEIGYAMNAFADHFLGDSFASGHIRTPRRVLHGDNKDVQGAVNWVLDQIKRVTDPNYKPDPSIGNNVSLSNAVAAVAPDLCSKVCPSTSSFDRSATHLYYSTCTTKTTPSASGFATVAASNGRPTAIRNSSRQATSKTTP